MSFAVYCHCQLEFDNNNSFLTVLPRFEPGSIQANSCQALTLPLSKQPLFPLYFVFVGCLINSFIHTIKFRLEIQADLIILGSLITIQNSVVSIHNSTITGAESLSGAVFNIISNQNNLIASGNTFLLCEAKIEAAIISFDIFASISFGGDILGNLNLDFHQNSFLSNKAKKASILLINKEQLFHNNIKINLA